MNDESEDDQRPPTADMLEAVDRAFRAGERDKGTCQCLCDAHDPSECLHIAEGNDGLCAVCRTYLYIQDYSQPGG